MKIYLLLLSLFVLMFTNVSFCKKFGSNEKPKYSCNKKESKLKIFIEGTWGDFDYLRRNLKFVDFVNDPLVADIHIIIKQRINGGGGLVYSITFNNRNFKNMGDYTLSCSSAASDTHEERRETITKTLKLGLMPYANESGTSEKITVQYHGKQIDAQSAEQIDPWKSWTFRGDLSGYLHLEETRKNLDYRYNLTGDKVTENWRLRNRAFMSVTKGEVITDDESYKTENTKYYYSSNIVKSLSKRMSAGAFTDYTNSNYDNILYSVTAKAAVEYNIFPWDISDRKVFTIAYYNGPEWQRYYEETIYSKLKEVLWEQTLQMNLKIVDTWGQFNTTLFASNYLHDYSKNTIAFNSILSFRIVRGVSVNLNVLAKNIHNQIYLPKSQASLEDILLNRIKLPSSFEVYTGLGVGIQFGSIYNNVINHRLY